MPTLDYQSKSPPRRKWLFATVLVLVGVCGTGAAAVSWVFVCRQQAASIRIPAASRFAATEKARRWRSYAQMHETIVRRFVNSRGFGDARLMDEIYWTENSTIEVKGQLYWVGPVQLISLNDGKDPFVYSHDNGKSPCKGELKGPNEFKRVALDSGQADALKELQAGKEMVQTGSGADLRLVGALRATTSCLKCHEVEKGTLLGAFNYPLIATNTTQ